MYTKTSAALNVAETYQNNELQLEQEKFTYQYTQQTRKQRSVCIAV